MVLKKILVYIILVFLAGCSLLSKNGHLPEQIVPAYSDPEEARIEVQVDKAQTNADQNDEQIEVIKMNAQGELSSKSSLAPGLKERDIERELSLPKKTSSLPYPLIVQSLIARAEKAIGMQQWLRAQHILEQGLHIAPNNAKVFLIYGDVYFNLGILAQAEQMYRRSVSLAGDQSPVGRLAMTKLEALKTGN